MSARRVTVGGPTWIRARVRAREVCQLSVIPTNGRTRFVAADPPRDGIVEFSDERRTVSLPVRAAIPVLARSRDRPDTSGSTALLSGALLLAMRLVSAGRIEPADSGRHWRMAALTERDEEQVRALAHSRLADVDDAEALVRAFLDAVADALPRSAPVGSRQRPVDDPPTTRRTNEPRDDFVRRLQRRIRAEAPDGAARPELVSLSLRMEADEEELVGGSVRAVLQVHDERDPLHLADAAALWTESPEAHGFGHRARVHTLIALRAAAEAWPVLDRLLDAAVPDQLTLDTDDLVSLLEDGVAALKTRGIDVLWPRSLGRDLTATTVLDKADKKPTDKPWEEPLKEPMFSEEALFSFRWQLAMHGEPLTDAEMDELAAATSPLLKLRGNWTIVDPSMLRRARKRLVRTVKPAEAIAAALTGTVEVGEEAEQVVVGASLLAVREQLRGAPAREPLPPPAGLTATLRDYQLQGFSWLAELTDLGLGGCLADDMGLGKTVTLLALHLHRGGPTLVVCPTSLMGNWEAEVRRFAPGVRTRRFHGDSRDLDCLDAGGHEIVLTTYGTLRRAVEKGETRVGLAGVEWDLVVADEAQHVKNERTATARALRRITSRVRVALTGTPVENNLTDLWAILDWVIPGLLGSRNAFRKVWAAPIESGREPSKAAQFADLISPFVLRRRKSDPGIAPELPEKTETDHILGLTREQTVLYEGFVRGTMERIERADPFTRRGLVLMLLTGLKQICNHPAQFLKQSNPRLGGRSEKFDLVDELVETILAEDGAVLLFTQYVELGRLLETHLTARGWEHQFLHGGTPVQRRTAMVEAFQAGGVPIFLLSLKAGGTGLNLTRADHVIHVDRWWNPAVEDQATDRAHRIGQTKPVQVHRLVTRGTIEERIAQLLADKRTLADSVLGRGEAALTELSDAELRDLVTLR